MGDKKQPAQVTQLLIQLRDGRREAFGELIPLVYDDLRRIARAHMHARSHGATMQTTALVHEAFLNLVDRTQIDWEDREHFLSVYSVVMRNLLVDMARARQALKRGGEEPRQRVDVADVQVDSQAEQILAIAQALTRLDEVDTRMARVVECRFFAGLTEEETARALQVTSRTIRRDWLKAKAVLREWL